MKKRVRLESRKGERERTCMHSVYPDPSTVCTVRENAKHGCPALYKGEASPLLLLSPSKRHFFFWVSTKRPPPPPHPCFFIFIILSVPIYTYRVKAN